MTKKLLGTVLVTAAFVTAALVAAPAAEAVPAGSLVKNMYNGRCLTATGTNNGWQVQLNDCNPDSAYQRWTLNTISTPSGTYYEVRNTASNRCLDGAWEGIGSNGTRMQIWDCLGSGQSNQHWRLTAATNQPGSYQVKVQTNNRCLDAAFEQITWNGGRAQLWDCLGPGQINQLWQLA